MEQVNCKNLPIIQITNSFAFAGSVQRGEGGEHSQYGCVPDCPGPPQGEWAAAGSDVFLFQLFPFQLFINHLLQDYILRLGKDHGKIRSRPYFGSRRRRSFADQFLSSVLFWEPTNWPYNNHNHMIWWDLSFQRWTTTQLHPSLSNWWKPATRRPWRGCSGSKT